ncbi:MAG: CvpA family protein [Chloroflexi bacterium]|nr:CvpA family protein [Chloroflexota bacterium]
MFDGFNGLDALLLLVIALHALQGLRQGLLVGLVELAGLLLALVVGLWGYLPLSHQLVAFTPLAYGLAKPVAFMAVWILTDVVYELIVRGNIPASWWHAPVKPLEHALGLLPGAARVSLAAAVVLMVASTVPFPEPGAAQLRDSRINQQVQPRTAFLNREFSQIFGDAVQETIGLLTVKPESDQRVKLSFTVSNPKTDEQAEGKMLVLLNQERTSRGLLPLVADTALRDVARAHSQDMFVRGYFGHVDPDGRSPFERMQNAGIQYRAAGENLALAPTVDVAHTGLMNSEGHRENIVNPAFGRVGIGVMDGGLHGEMFTQSFAD